MKNHQGWQITSVHVSITDFLPSKITLALVSRLSENKSQYECMLFTTSLFISNPMKR